VGAANAEATAVESSRVRIGRLHAWYNLWGERICADCGDPLEKGVLFYREVRSGKDCALCLTCADLDHLVYLHRGDTALTRRATHHSRLHAVVWRFSSARKRNERQGVLVQEEALQQAEQECLADAEARARARKRAAGHRARDEQDYLERFTDALGELFPGCPPAEQQAIAAHACEKHSGRVGRSAAAKQLEATAIRLAVAAHVRHVHTDYDSLLMAGVERRDAREEVGGTVERILQQWADKPAPEPPVSPAAGPPMAAAC